jgi:hypothetical protein
MARKPSKRAKRLFVGLPLSRVMMVAICAMRHTQFWVAHCRYHLIVMLAHLMTI